MITIKNNQRTVAIDRKQIHADMQKLLTACDYADFDIGILITSDRGIQRYNKKFRAIDKPTDVLSFPYHASAKPDKKIIAHTPEEHNLGDIVIAAPYVARVAQELDVSFEQHLQRMLVHGLCHLIGYTHETDHDHHAMNTKEQELLKLFIV